MSAIRATHAGREPTIFDRILDGEIPCHRVYENDHVLAFLDVGPLSRGHTLVIPKERVGRLDELSENAAAAVGRTLPRIGRAVMQVSGSDDYNVLLNNGKRAGQEVMHVHFHVIPKFDASGLAKTWHPGTLAPEEAREILAGMHEVLDR